MLKRFRISGDPCASNCLEPVWKLLLAVAWLARAANSLRRRRLTDCEPSTVCLRAARSHCLAMPALQLCMQAGQRNLRCCRAVVCRLCVKRWEALRVCERTLGGANAGVGLHFSKICAFHPISSQIDVQKL